MKYLKTVYVHRYDEKEHIWHKSEFSRVLVSGTVNGYDLSDTLNRDTQIVLRVMGTDDADILPQDVISFEVTEGEAPPSANTAVVVSVTKNSRGSAKVRHTKIVCR